MLKNGKEAIVCRRYSKSNYFDNSKMARKQSSVGDIVNIIIIRQMSNVKSCLIRFK